MMKTRHVFDQQLTALEQEIVRLGGVVEEMLGQAMLSLNKDQDLAKEVINVDDLADSLDLYIETRCMRLLALPTNVAERVYYMETGRLKKTPKLQQAVYDLPERNGAPP
jgi:phosphate transport system protein